MTASSKDLAENMRFYADVRFKQLTLLLVAMAGAAAAVGREPVVVLAPRVTVRTAVSVMAVFVVAVLWIMEVRAAAYWAAHREVAPDAWPGPKSSVFSWINATNALLLLHAGLFGAWWWLGLTWQLAPVWLVVTGILFIILVAFSVVMYQPLWSFARKASKKSAR